MDVLLPVFIAVLLAEMGGKVQALSHRLSQTSSHVLAALFVAAIASCSFAAIGGAVIAPLISFQARTLLGGLALLLAGAPNLLPLRTAPEPAMTIGFIGLCLRFARAQFGDASQFIIFAFAARANMPVLGAVAGMLAITLVSAPAILAHEDWPGPLPLKLLRIAGAVALSVAGGWMIVSALRLI
jgi:Ca2+/H+ antiporter, TMEM165/GDT1 family